MSVRRSLVIGSGAYLPERVVTNDELAAQVDTSDEWIVQRTGIRKRHFAAKDERTSDLAISTSLWTISPKASPKRLPWGKWEMNRCSASGVPLESAACQAADSVRSDGGAASPGLATPRGARNTA